MMAKNKADRYPSPAELAIDLECLLQGEPPKFARQKMEVAMLEDLAKGEAIQRKVPIGRAHTAATERAACPCCGFIFSR